MTDRGGYWKDGAGREPGWLSYLGELRVFAELGTLAPAIPALLSAPRGDGHAVLVLPGVLTGDESTLVIRRYLEELGYAAHPWKQGHNWGPSRELHDKLRARLKELYDRYGRRLSIVGWSLGGIFARELAREFPFAVRQVVTLGSPFGSDIAADGSRKPEAAARRLPAAARALHLDLFEERRHRALGSLPRTPLAPHRQYRGACDPYRHGLQPAGALGDRRPAGAKRE